jgi:3-dehydrosphinganine reductase
MDWFANKKIVITGGSSGIGKATATLAAQWGSNVCIVARDAAKLEKACAEIKANAKNADRKVLSMQLDVSDRDAVNRAAPDIAKRLGGIDVLINCAGIAWPGYVDTIPDRVWDSMIAVDYMGTVNMVRAFLPDFIAQKHGAIANVSSACGYMGVFGYSAYCPAKFAVVGFSECLRQDLLPYNIDISVIFPPDTDTPQLQEENKIKPPETKALAGAIKVMKPETIALAFLKGIAGRRFTIVPGTMNKFTYFMSKHFPSIVWMIISGDLRKFWKKHPLR